MAQASSAQREPSMEEILASIRRIIEDSDVEKKREADDVGSSIAAPANDVIDRSKEVEAFRAEFDGAPHDHELLLSEAEAANELHPARDQEEAGAEGPDPVFVAVPVAPAQELRSAAELDLEIAVKAATAQPMDRAAAPLSMPEAAAVPSEAASADLTPRPPLVSERAGRQVAAAFGELSEAFAASRRRSFDEMAEEMLRPMLQDWLDNNLPHLVERLVREEIERIARG